MSNRSYKPANMPQLLPYLAVQDAEKSITFYQEAFGFQLSSEPAKNEQGKIQHVEMQFGEEAVIMFAPEAACAEMGIQRKAPISLGVMVSLTLYVYCKDVDVLYKKAVENGAKVTMEPNDTFWGIGVAI